MSQSRSGAMNDATVDDYPVRPNSSAQNGQIASSRLTGQKRTIIIFSLIYILYGTGLCMYSLLYLKMARKNGLSSWLYATVLASSHLMCVLFYPLSCHIASKVPLRNSFSVSIFVIGSCRILFGSTSLFSDKITFITLTFAIQLVEGIGMSIFIASTIVKIGSSANDQTWKLFLALQISLCLGLILGPPSLQALNEELGFDVAFYIVGGFTVLSVTLTATLLKDPEEQINYIDLPVVYWMSDKKMIVYFFIILETFIYVGFLSVSLGTILNKFNINNLYFAMIFSLTPFAYGLTISGWKWLIKKGFNNVMLVFIGSVAIAVSLILIGPAPFTSLEASLAYICSALILEGLGLACKCICVLDASEKDLRSQRKYTEIQQKLIVPTIVMLGASFGYFCGLLTAGIMNYYLEYKRATLPYFVLEIVTAVGVVIFAMNRNYISKRRREAVSERQPILTS